MTVRRPNPAPGTSLLPSATLLQTSEGALEPRTLAYPQQLSALSPASTAPRVLHCQSTA
eukprot:CAMPEP_0181296094 /NCGR_PEP_ID=MMETSP1101-20121128/4508_1 /TAXON_ID=46948 /ORGANISM="Rhodomonas abbreviata, Strain Caron Lab Isolate" /LENGTH=58 /DNA_ID=CAMNT_0023400911 /DNA_START=193 /DNA_END=369 /DNA_ORIENTATION=+